MVFDAVLYRCHEVLQIGFQLLGNIVRVETAFMGIADDGRLAVVGGYNDEAVLGIKDIEGGRALICSIAALRDFESLIIIISFAAYSASASMLSPSTR